MKKLITYLLIFNFSFFSIVSQNDTISKPKWCLKPVVNAGFILVHRSTIGHLVKGYPTIYEVDIVKSTYGNKLWQLENNKPDIGVSFQCIDFKNPHQLGYAFIVAPFV